ncbi:hypothetical protein CCACVL1_03433 [Corchorus capsularis]|uniref:Uncharacterized protein n=1 Tax=Corchorus capsularis TaxID=210143 RepID=A0A1R3JZL1_COCAP|nr:hypothetical protein CCACVL1_03433 [Corchorus capsularis]
MGPTTTSDFEVGGDQFEPPIDHLVQQPLFEIDGAYGMKKILTS